MSVGWLKVRRTDDETFEKQKIMPHALPIILGYKVCWSWHAYFKLKDHQIIGTPHGGTILDRIMKNETANPPPPPPTPPKSWMKPCKSKTHHFPSLVWREGGIDFPSNVAEYLLILPTQDCVMKFLLQATQYHGDLWRQNHDNKLVRVSGIFSRPRSVTSSVLTKYSNYNSKLILTAGRVTGKRKKKTKIKWH